MLRVSFMILLLANLKNHNLFFLYISFIPYKEDQFDL